MQDSAQKAVTLIALTLLAIAPVLILVTESKTASVKAFVYEDATKAERIAWLNSRAESYRRNYTGNLPNGFGFSPRLIVAETSIDDASRTIQFRVEATEPAQLANNATAIEREWLKKACLKFIHSPLYRVRVTVVDSFHLMDGRRVFQAVISPTRCDALYPPLGYVGDVL